MPQSIRDTRALPYVVAGVVTLAGLGPPRLAAQETRPLTEPAEYTLEQWTTEHGLPQNSVTSLAIGPDGHLWIGTFGGLARFDGATFRVMERTDSAGRHLDRILSLAVGPDSTVWIGTERDGLLRYRNGMYDLFTTAHGLPNDQILTLRVDSAGTLWVGGPSDAVARFADGRFEVAPDWPEQAFETTTTVGADAGMAHAFGITPDRSGGYWLGTANDGLFHYRAQAGARALRHYPLPSGRENYRVRTILVDDEGIAWIGTDANGLVRAKRNLFTTYTRAHGLSHDVATAIYQDAGGTVWAATNCWGVNALDLDRRTVRTHKPRRPDDPEGDPCVFAVTEASPGTMWMGTYGGGLTRLRAGREERFHHLEGLRDSVVLALFTDRDGTVWVGTNSGGLASLTDARVTATYTTADGLAHNSVRAIYQTADGALWIGTLGGVSRLKDGRFTNYTVADGLSAAHVRSFHEDADGNLWIGTYGGGLNRLRDGVITPVMQRHGLADNVVSAILEDAHGHFWMSGNRGIYRVDREQLVAFVEGRTDRIHSVLYGPGDGLLNAETNGGFQPAGWKDTRGHLWFPTVEGVAVVDPARASPLERPPSVTVEEVVVDGEPRPAQGGIAVGPGRPNLEFRYAGLSLSAPEHITFRYRLEGFDEGWTDAGSRRVAYYPRLQPGSYRFVVTAANRDGVRNETGTQLELRIAAPMTSTWWFRLTGAAIVLGLGALLVRRRELVARRTQAAQEAFSRRLMESQEHERRRLAGELHDGLGQDLLVVKNRALLALREDGLAPPVRGELEQITDVIGQSLETVRGLAHHLTPYQLEHLGLSSALQSMVESVAGMTDTLFEVDVENIDGLLPMDAEINLYRIVQEALNNVVRHAHANRAAVRVRHARAAIEVEVEDDGRGFEVERDGRGRLAGGFGLSGLGERVRMLDGRIVVTSAAGEGTRLAVSVPVAAVREAET